MAEGPRPSRATPIVSPRERCLTAKESTSLTSGCLLIASSTSKGEMTSPPLLMISLSRPTSER
jgi:hypothetical protein